MANGAASRFQAQGGRRPRRAPRVPATCRSTIGPDVAARTEDDVGRRCRGCACGRVAPSRPARRAQESETGPARQAGTLNVSVSKPASGTSRASTRSGDPANVTARRARLGLPPPRAPRPACPRLRSGKRNFGGDDDVVHRDVKEDPHSGEQHDETRARTRRTERNPVAGATPSTAARLTAACAETRVVTPREPLAKGIAAAQNNR